ncbi:MAG: SNF2 family helicase [Lachnospiraceae bacterium]|nr:SNF2 family helicase [Lachnospiraceae bacterium]
MAEEKEEMFIRRFCADDETYEKGKALRDKSGILSLDRTVSTRSKRIYISGSVRDEQELYGPWLIYDQEAGELTSYFCQCGHCGSRYGGMCEHCAALFAEYGERYSLGGEVTEKIPDSIPGMENLLGVLPEQDHRRGAEAAQGKRSLYVGEGAPDFGAQPSGLGSRDGARHYKVSGEESREAEEGAAAGQQRTPGNDDFGAESDSANRGETLYQLLDDPCGEEVYAPEEIEGILESNMRREPQSSGNNAATATTMTDEAYQSFRGFEGSIGEWLKSVGADAWGAGAAPQNAQNAQRERAIHPDTDKRLAGLIQDYAVKNRLTDQTANGVIDLEPTLEEERESYGWFVSEDDKIHYLLTFRISNDTGKSYLIKNIVAFAQAIREEKNYSHGKFICFVHSKSMFTERGWQYCELILAAAGRDRGTAYVKELPAYPDTLDRLMELKMDQELLWSGEGFVTVRDQNPPLRVLIRKNDEDYSIEFEKMRILKGEKYSYILLDGILYRPKQEFLRDMKEWLKTLSATSVRSFDVAALDMPAFCAAVLPTLQKYDLVEFEGFSPEEFMPKKPVFSFYIDEDGGVAEAKCYVEYGTLRYNLLHESGNGWGGRDLSGERRIRAMLEVYFPEVDESGDAFCFFGEEDERMYRLLTVGLAQLAAEGKVYVTDRIRAHRIIDRPRAQIGIAVAGGMLELTVITEEFPREELADIIDSYRQKKKYHRLRDGRFLNMEDNAVSGIAELMDGMLLTDRQIAAEHVEVPKYWAAYLDQSLKQGSGHLRVDRGRDYKAIIRQMNNAADSDYEVPASLADTLRGYQKTGYRWMRVLTELGFGGILADDMGLGKTLQTITCLLARKQEDQIHKPCLVVCPASLIYNWQKEFERFAPEMTVQVITGSAAERARMIRVSNLPNGRTGTDDADSAWIQEGMCIPDVWITSYDMLKRDIDEYRQISFDTEIIDESQNIKNQNTLASKAVKQIRADTRFALTGTPIENRLSELWSCFDYLMPGILGTYNKFRKKFEIPIVQNRDEDTLARLKRMVSPFILRRLKQDVLKELPDKLEQVVYAKMEGEQRKLYAAHAQRLYDSIRMKSAESFREDQIAILAEMTKLRQLCCDPSLLFEDYHDASCKMDTCIELVREAVEGKHKVLIFSQFTSVFPLIEERLRAEEIDWYELTGATPKKERQRLTEAFNADDVPVFLISLKAGGTGLNLTAATIVIHYDPWWNLAAQNQATDRAHRIGQENQVVVFKLIAQDTIEEKILNLQEKKGMLAKQVLEGGQSGPGKLTREDLMEILEFAT